MRRTLLTLSLLCATPAAAQSVLAENGIWTPAKICNEIAAASVKHGVPRNFFTRLIWIESRFDRNARSPVGAQGIAQFMPATAKFEGLADPFDPAQAIPASAALLAKEKARFGNFGLAAAAYNAGANRVSRFVAGNSGLPFETQDYVAAITGRAAVTFRGNAPEVSDTPLEKGRDFFDACRDLPVKRTRFGGAVAGIDADPLPPWGVQVAGNYRRNVAQRSWTRVRSKLGLAVGDARPRLLKVRSPRGRARQWAVRLGTDTRAEAIRLCKRIRAVGGFCLVKRNR